MFLICIIFIIFVGDRLSGFQDDLSGFQSVIELIAAEDPSGQAILNGFKNALILCTRIRLV